MDGRERRGARDGCHAARPPGAAAASLPLASRARSGGTGGGREGQVPEAVATPRGSPPREAEPARTSGCPLMAACPRIAAYGRRVGEG